MNIKYSKPKTQRIFKSSRRIAPFHIKGNGPNYYLDLWEGKCYMEGKWYTFNIPSYKSIYSLKACKRFIHKIDVPKGFQFLVLLPYYNHYFIITK